MIALKNIRKIYTNCTALDNVNLNIEAGEFVAIVGKSGSGKSTLLNIIGLLDQQTEGQVLINGISVNSLNEKQKARFRLHVIGHIFQSFNLEPAYTVYKNIEIPLLIANIDKVERDAIIKKTIDDVGLSHKLYVKANTLSGGEQQRVCIARALVNSPRIILADEPCGNLDTTNSAIIMDILKGLSSKGITVILVTHDLTDAQIADRIIEIEDGKIKN